ncbi:MAG: hypothetical protein QW578_05205 [Thermoplasmatales archaeon]
MGTEFSKKAEEFEAKRAENKKKGDINRTLKEKWAPSVFLPRRDSFLLGKYNFNPIDITGFPRVIPPALCASFYNKYSDLIIVETFKRIENQSIMSALEKAEQSAKTNLLLLKDTSGFEANALASRIRSLEESKEYLLNQGAFWEFEMKLFTRISEEDIKNRLEADRHDEYTQKVKDILAGVGFTFRKRFMNMKKYVNYLAPIAYKETDFQKSSEFQPFTTEAINNLFPIVVGSNFGTSGDVYGRDIVTGLPVVIDRFT